MRNGLSDLAKEQLKFLLPRAAAADGLLFIACIILQVTWYRALTGLLLGTLTMTVNMLLLSYSVRHAVDRGSEKAAKRYMLGFYILRFSIMGAAIAAGFLWPLAHPVCTYLPLLYPKLFYSWTGIKDHIHFILTDKKR
ncbi:MAG: ATP synthase subunit I [Oscillospiraceae bacterium]|nr:ATP synthase subunit I [Oscillospiraceae bacterium]